MKIALITNLYPPYNRGGAEKIAQLMAENLNIDHDIFIISTMPKTDATSHKGFWEKTTIKNKKPRIFRFNPINLFYYLDDYKHNIFIRLIWHIIDTFNLHSYQIVKKILKTEQPDLVITHNLKGLGFWIVKAISILKIKHIHILHDVQYAIPSGLMLWKKENSFIANGFFTKIYQSIVKKLFKNTSIIISPSHWLLKFYEEKDFFRKIKKIVIPNPVNLNSNKFCCNKKNKYSKFLFVGQIEPHKGLEWLLKIFAKTELQLDIVGEGSDLNYLKEKFSSEKIKFYGRQNHEKLDQFYKNSDYLIVPSLCYENSPTVIYEAFSHALPVIASNIGGISELINNYENGYLFTPEDNIQFENIINLAQANKDYCKMSEQAFHDINKFSTNSYLNKLKETL